MNPLGKAVFIASFSLALIWTFALWRIAHPKRRKPVPCVHRWRTIEHYPTGHKKAGCTQCGAIRLFVPPLKRSL